jgi:hypothetical protein
MKNDYKGILIGEKVKIFKNFATQFTFPEIYKNHPQYFLIQKIFWDNYQLFYEINLDYPIFSKNN